MPRPWRSASSFSAWTGVTPWALFSSSITLPYGHMTTHLCRYAMRVLGRPVVGVGEGGSSRPVLGFQGRQISHWKCNWQLTGSEVRSKAGGREWEVAGPFALLLVSASGVSRECR